MTTDLRCKITSPYMAEALYNFVLDVCLEDYEDKKKQFKDGLSMVEYVLFFCPEEFKEYCEEFGLWCAD